MNYSDAPPLVDAIQRAIDAERERQQEAVWAEEQAKHEELVRVEAERRRKLEENLERIANALDRLTYSLDLIRCSGIQLHRP